MWLFQKQYFTFHKDKKKSNFLCSHQHSSSLYLHQPLSQWGQVAGNFSHYVATRTCTLYIASLLLVCGLRLHILSQLASISIVKAERYYIWSTPPQLSLNLVLSNSGIDKKTVILRYWLFQILLGPSIFGRSGLTSIGQPHFCLFVGLHFTYDVSLHQFLVWMAERYSVWSTPPQHSLLEFGII